MAAWATASGITGLTLPGMIDEPAWRGGRRISPSPACGPDESSRRSLAIFSRFDGQGAEDAAHFDEGVGVLRGLDQVLGPGQAPGR